MKIAVGFAGPDLQQITREFGLIANDEQMALAMMQSNWELFNKSLDEGEPDLLIIYADIAPGIDTLVDRLSKLQHGVAIVLLPTGWTDLQGVIEKIDTVRGVYVQPAAPAEVLKRGISAVQTERAKRQAISPLGQVFSRAERSTAVVGTRVIAFVSAQGGVGKSTLAEGLGFELVARRNIHSLLFSFDLPATATLRLDIRSQPSAQEFFTQPGPLGFKESIQTTKDGLDVVVPPNASYTFANAALVSPEDPRSIRSLVVTSYAFNYGAILLDLPAGEGAWTLQPLLVANLILIVSRPTLEGIRATAHFARLLTENLQSDHRIPKESIFVVLNQRTKNSTFTASSFHQKGSNEYGWFPPVLATIDFDPVIPQAQDAARPAINVSEDLGKNIAGLVDTFYGNLDQGSNNKRYKGRSFLGIRIRMGG
jgi:MinD-like ATPase involved in chromosome partitioning or flagellar assembly